MKLRNGLWTKEQTGSKITVADMRLRRYVSIYAAKRAADRQAYEESKMFCLVEATNDLKEEAFANVATASRWAAGVIRRATEVHVASSWALNKAQARLADTK